VNAPSSAEAYELEPSLRLRCRNWKDARYLPTTTSFHQHLAHQKPSVAVALTTRGVTNQSFNPVRRFNHVACLAAVQIEIIREKNLWRSRHDSNLQPDCYERLGSLGSIGSDCGYSFWRVPFIAICSRHIGGQSVVGGKSRRPNAVHPKHSRRFA
jgi:hypothetical protein